MQYLQKYAKLTVWDFVRTCVKQEYQNYLGTTSRIGPNDLITNDSELLNRMNAARGKYVRGKFFEAFQFKPGVDNILSITDINRHDNLRLRVGPGYRAKEIPSLETVVDECVQDLVELIKRKYIFSKSDPKMIDFGSAAQYFTLDVITSVAFGNKFGFISEDRDIYCFVKASHESMLLMAIIAMIPALKAVFKIPIFLSYFAPSTDDVLGFGKVMEIAQKVVAERFGPDAKVKEDMLQSFIRHGVSQEEMESEAMVQLAAGSDTTATAIRSTFLHIITNPLVYRTLQREIDSFVHLNKTTDSTIISDAQAQKLPFLQACIKEGLRIWPPVASIVPKVVPEKGDMVDGKFIPGGTNICWAIWGVQQNQAVYGEDAKSFRPERWLDATGERLAKMEMTWNLIFGGGRYGCLGKGLALIELNKVFVELLRRFDFVVLNPAHPWDSYDLGIFMQREMYVRVTEREIVE